MTDPAEATPPIRTQKYRASQSFRDEEVNVILTLFDKLYQGYDVSTIVRSGAAKKVWAKFQAMRVNLDKKA